MVGKSPDQQEKELWKTTRLCSVPDSSIMNAARFGVQNGCKLKMNPFRSNPNQHVMVKFMVNWKA